MPIDAPTVLPYVSHTSPSQRSVKPLFTPTL
jgi:hypothetical protein